MPTLTKIVDYLSSQCVNDSFEIMVKIISLLCLKLLCIYFRQGNAISHLSTHHSENLKCLVTLQRHFAQHGHLFDLPFSMRLISKVIPVLNPPHQFQRLIHIESPQGQNHLQENPKLRERNGRSFFPPILFSNAREKNEPACTSTCGGSILQIFSPRTDPSPARSWSLRSIALWPI